MEKDTGSTMKYLLTADELRMLAGPDADDPASFLVPEGLKTLGSRLGGRRTGLRPSAVRQCLSRLGFPYDFRVIAHINLRGGIGKTTSTVTAATRACQYGFKTCILDLDPQGSSSLALDRMAGVEDPIFYDLWQNPAEMLKGSLKKIQEYLYILPSSLENALLDASLINPASQKRAVRGVCRELKEDGFDAVIIDCPPSLGIAVISAICAADLVVIPTGSDAFSFKGLELTLSEISSICATFGLEKPLVKVLFTRFDRREKICLDALSRFSSEYGDYLIPRVIRTSTDYAKALARKETVFGSSRKSPARDDYDYYVRHIFGLEGLAAGR